MNSLISKRIAIVELHKQGKRPCEIINLLGYGKKFVFRTINSFKKTNSVFDHARSGRPRTVNNSDVVKNVKNKINYNPRQSLRKLAKKN